MTSANLQSVQALLAFRDALPNLSDAAINEVQQLVQSAQSTIEEAAQALTECREQLWQEEDKLRNTEEPNRSDYSAVENLRKEVAQAETNLSEIQGAYTSFQRLSNIVGNRLAVNFENATRFLDERIEAIKQYQSISLSDHTQNSADNSLVQAVRTPAAAQSRGATADNIVGTSPLRAASAADHPAANTPAFESGKRARLEGMVQDSNPYRGLAGREGAANIWDQGWQSQSELPELPNGMEWVEIDKIKWNDVPDDLEFKKVPKENMKEMLETFEYRLLPILTENKDVSVNDLMAVDKENTTEGSSSSLMLCHDSMIGSSQASDVVVLHSKPAANTGERELGFTSGRHRTLVAKELGWKYIPARVIG